MEIIKTDIELLRKNITESHYRDMEMIATECRITQTQLLLIISGKVQPTSDVMYKLVDVLGIHHQTAGKIFFSTTLK